MRVRERLSKSLFAPIEHFLYVNCACKEKALFQYCKGLKYTQAWPVDVNGQRESIQDMLNRLKEYVEYIPPEGACVDCEVD